MQNKQKILLLNPPGKKLYLRDYFCSKVSKADYINSPVDFVMLSGVLNTGDFEIQLLDAIVEKISAGDCLARIKKQNFDIIIALIGSVSLKEDEIFLYYWHCGLLGQKGRLIILFSSAYFASTQLVGSQQV